MQIAGYLATIFKPVSPMTKEAASKPFTLIDQFAIFNRSVSSTRAVPPSGRKLIELICRLEVLWWSGRSEGVGAMKEWDLIRGEEMCVNPPVTHSFDIYIM